MEYGVIRTTLGDFAEQWVKESAGLGAISTVMGSSSKKGVGSTLGSRMGDKAGIVRPSRPVRNPQRSAMPSPARPTLANPPALPRAFAVPAPKPFKMSSAAGVGSAFVRGALHAVKLPWRALPGSAKAAIGIGLGGYGAYRGGKAAFGKIDSMQQSSRLLAPDNVARNRLQQTFWGGAPSVPTYPAAAY